MITFLIDCEFDKSKNLMRIDNIAESEVALTKLKKVEDMTLYIGNTNLSQILDLTSDGFGPTRRLHLILENNPYLELRSLSLDGTHAPTTYYTVFEIRGRGLKTFHKNLYSGDLVLRNLPKTFDVLNNCDYIHAADITIEGSLPSPCYINVKSNPSSYNLINVDTIDGERVLDPKAFCQVYSAQIHTSIVNSTVVLPVGCFRRKLGPLQVIQIDLWNLQKSCILEISIIDEINGFHMLFNEDEKLDRLWKSRSPEDCKNFCFDADSATIRTH